MEASLARERQESSKVNILNARLEQRVAELEQSMTQGTIVTNENSKESLNTLKHSSKSKAK